MTNTAQSVPYTKRYVWFYLPFIFYGIGFDIRKRAFIAGWRILLIAAGDLPNGRKVIFSSTVLRANRNQYSLKELCQMSLFRRLICSGWWC